MAAANEPQHISRALSELVLRRGIARVRGEAQLAGLWKQIAGESIARNTKVIGIRRGVLQVAVSSAPLLGELAGFHKTSLLKALQKQHPHLKIRDLAFRLRSGSGKSES